MPAVLYLQSEGLNISWMYPGLIPFQYLKTVFAIQYSTLLLTGSQFVFLKCDVLKWNLWDKFRQKGIHLFWAFWESATRSDLRKKTFLKFSKKFIGKHLCQSHFLNKVAGIRPSIWSKKETLAWMFSCEFAKLLRALLFIQHLVTASAFWSLNFKFFFKRRNHEKHPWLKCGWIGPLHNSLVYSGVRYLLWQ